MAWRETYIVCPSCGRNTGEIRRHATDFYFEGLYTCSFCGFRFLDTPDGDSDLELVSNYGAEESCDSPEKTVMLHEAIRKVTLAFSTLSKRERQVIRLRFGLEGITPRTLKQVGDEFCVGRERIRTTQNRALARLRLKVLFSSTTLDRILSNGEPLL